MEERVLHGLGFRGQGVKGQRGAPTRSAQQRFTRVLFHPLVCMEDIMGPRVPTARPARAVAFPVTGEVQRPHAHVALLELGGPGLQPARMTTGTVNQQRRML